MLPSAGQGAINAMQDATILANCINDIKRLDRDSISAHLKDYQDQRYQFAKIQFETSKRFAVIMGGQVTKKKQSLSKKNKGWLYHDLIVANWGGGGVVGGCLSREPEALNAQLLFSVSNNLDMVGGIDQEGGTGLHAQITEQKTARQDMCLPTTGKFLEAGSWTRRDRDFATGTL